MPVPPTIQAMIAHLSPEQLRERSRLLSIDSKRYMRRGLKKEAEAALNKSRLLFKAANEKERNK